MAAEPVVLAVDFDGVVCDGRPEYFEAARRAHAALWPDLTLPADAEARFTARRPLIESGWEMPLLLHALVRRVSLPGPGDRAAWLATAASLLPQSGHTREALATTLNTVRDEWFARDPAGWRAMHTFYPGVVERLDAALAAGVRVAIVTTKAERFVRALLAPHGARVSGLPVIGREPDRTVPKVESLRQLSAVHGLACGAGLWFVEDMLETLRTVAAAPAVGASRLFLADWGYTTLEHRAAAALTARVTLLSLPRLRGPFGAWLVDGA